MKLKYFTVVLRFIVTMGIEGQITVSGTVIEASTGDPAIGVTVLEQGTNNGTVTDLDGNYTLPGVAIMPRW